MKRLLSGLLVCLLLAAAPTALAQGGGDASWNSGIQHIDAFSDGLAVVAKDGKYGFIDTAGRLVIPCEWDWAQPFTEDLALVMKDGRCGFIDTAGVLAIPCEYDDALFSEGCFILLKDGVVIILDRELNRIL